MKCFSKNGQYTVFFLILILLILCVLETNLTKRDTQKNELFGVKNSEQNVRVAVIDSGFAEDVQWRREIGRNYLKNTEDTMDDVGHGTMLGEIIFQVAPMAVQIPLKITSKDEMTMPDMLINAIYDAIDVYHCDIINISGGMSHSDTLQQAIMYAEQKGVIVISAVGNQGDTYKADKIYYPVGYETVVEVGTIEEDGQIAAYSQKNESVFVVCQCGEEKGTSFSTAYITGLAATQTWSSPEEFRNWLREHAIDGGEAGYDTEYGWGYIEIIQMES